MKLFNIVSTAAIFSSTLTWAKNLEKSTEEAGKFSKEGLELLEEDLMIADLQIKHKRVDEMTSNLERQTAERDHQLNQLEKILSQNRKAIDKNVGDIFTNALQTSTNKKNINQNTFDMKSNRNNIEANKVQIAENRVAIEANTVAIDLNKSDIQDNSEAIAVLLSEDNICYNDYYSQTGEYCGEWVGATIRKLSLWGEQVEDAEIDFMWPDEATFAAMSPDVKVKTMRFLSDDHFSSVTVTLSNGEQSTFQNLFYWFLGASYFPHDETIDFDQFSSVRAVNAYGKAVNSIDAIQFFDSQQEVLAQYNPQDLEIPEDYNQLYRLEDNEELVGVYGVKDEENWFTSFGFLVKVKQD